ncbi:MAG: apolipoprotein N-acyltransferase [Flavobacteriales bacterium]|nr:apolipoprotein N-acyltransferase [Flavobacteriales bacterium]MCB9193296.1 apolipoprotein N-acyltransferase [Flavobacteriales bacterium]
MRDMQHVGWALFGGLLMVLAWPATGGLTPLLFIALVPWIRVAEDRWSHAPRHQRTLLVLYPGLLLWNMLTTHWLGNVQEGPATRFLTGWLVQMANAGLMTIPFVLTRHVRKRWGMAWGWTSFILFWTAFERLHHDWDLQWPWLTLGNGLSAHAEWVQWYAWTGHLGGSVWVLTVNVLVLLALRASRPAASRFRAIAAGLLIALPIGGSLVAHATYKERGPTTEVVIVQPDIDPYSEKFGGLAPMDQLDRMLDLAGGDMTDSTRLVVFPETALQENATLQMGPDGEVHLQGLWENDLGGSQSVGRIREWIQEHPGVAVLTGMSSAYLFGREEPRTITARKVGGTDRHYDAYNAALLVDAHGRLAVYHKSKLVAGVEMLPFEGLIGKLDFLSIDLGGTSGSLAGQRERSVLLADSGRIGVAPVICYESVFGDYVTGYVRNGADLIAIITNDGWWGDTPGYRQHLQYGRLRAIETRRDVVRAANTGISCWIDQRGDIHAPTSWWVPAVIRARVHLDQGTTFFVRHGDLTGRAAVFLSFLLIGVLLALGIRRWRIGK